jgi:hypothetical protein
MRSLLITLVVVIAVGTLVFLRRSKRVALASDKLVEVYDFKSETSRTIPAAELAPGMVRVKLQNGRVVWASVTDLKQGKLVHGPFSGEVRGYVEKIQKSLEEVYPHDYAFWEDGFRRDAKPEPEIALWLHIAQLFETFKENRSTTLEERKEAFKVLVACSNGTQETALQTVQLNNLPRSDAQLLVHQFFGGTKAKESK